MQRHLFSKEETYGCWWSLFWYIFPSSFVNGNHSLIQTYPDIDSIFPKQEYVPSIFGFKIEEKP